VRYRVSELVGIGSITLELENGKSVTVNIEKELSVPSDPEELWECARKAAGRLLFWKHQTARLRLKAKAQEDHLLVLLGGKTLTMRSSLAKMVESGENSHLDPNKFGVVSSVVENSPNVIEARKILRLRWNAYLIVSNIAAAFEQKLFLIRKRLGINSTFDSKEI
jgi:hypothetical protein